MPTSASVSGASGRNRYCAEQRTRLSTICMAAVDAAVDMILITDRDGVIEYVNPAFTRVTGYSPAQVLGAKPSVLKSGCHNEAFYRTMWSRITSGRVWQGVVTNRRKDGRLYPEEMTITPVSEVGGPISHFIAIKRDVSDREAAQQAMRHSEERYRKLFACSLDAVLIADTANGVIVDANASAAQLFGRPVDQIIGMLQPQLHPPEERDADQREFERRVRTGGVSTLNVQRADGRSVPVEVSASVFELDGRQLIQGHFRDLSERRRAEEAEHQRKALQEAVAAMERLLGVVGHELRTPLAALRATSEYLLTDDVGDDESTVFLNAIHDEVVRMAEMVNNLLEAARLNSGCAKWNWSDVSLSAACDEALNVVRPLIDHARVTLDWSVTPSDLVMRGDAAAICRLLINFVSNSAKHTSDGFIRIEVRGRKKKGRPWVDLCVTDSGEGISQRVAEKLGQAFMLNSGIVGSDYIKGAGLGLAICRGIVAAHGGHIVVKSTPGKGATFHIWMPADLPGAAIDHNDGAIEVA